MANSQCERGDGLDDFIVAAPRFITLTVAADATGRKTSILRAPIDAKRNGLVSSSSHAMPLACLLLACSHGFLTEPPPWEGLE